MPLDKKPDGQSDIDGFQPDRTPPNVPLKVREESETIDPGRRFASYFDKIAALQHLNENGKGGMDGRMTVKKNLQTSDGEADADGYLGEDGAEVGRDAISEDKRSGKAEGASGEDDEAGQWKEVVGGDPDHDGFPDAIVVMVEDWARPNVLTIKKPKSDSKSSKGSKSTKISTAFKKHPKAAVASMYPTAPAEGAPTSTAVPGAKWPTENMHGAGQFFKHAGIGILISIVGALAAVGLIFLFVRWYNKYGRFIDWKHNKYARAWRQSKARGVRVRAALDPRRVRRASFPRLRRHKSPDAEAAEEKKSGSAEGSSPERDAGATSASMTMTMLELDLAGARLDSGVFNPAGAVAAPRPDSGVLEAGEGVGGGMRAGGMGAAGGLGLGGGLGAGAGAGAETEPYPLPGQLSPVPSHLYSQHSAEYDYSAHGSITNFVLESSPGESRYVNPSQSASRSPSPSLRPSPRPSGVAVGTGA